MLLITALLGCLVIGLHCAEDVVLKRTYPEENKMELIAKKYTLRWEVDEAKQKLYLGLSAPTDGWIGFGFAEPSCGSMIGADIMVAWVDEEGKGHIEDRYATKFEKPEMDVKSQDWVLEAFHEEKDKYTAIEVSRSFTTEDGQDRDVKVGQMRVLVAFGETDELHFHQENRFSFGMSFIKDKWLSAIEPKEPDLKNFDIVFNEYPVPKRRTNYYCISAELPRLEKGAHIVKFETIEDTFELVHHLVLYACPATGESPEFEKFKTPQSCHAMHDCSTTVWAWGLHGEPMTLPPDAGILFGNDDPAGLPRRLVLQLHWDNEALKEGILDSSGVRLMYTPTLRKYHAGSLRMGDGAITFPPLLPKQDYIPFDTLCPSECTQDWPHPITIVGALMHMHEYGRRMWSSIHRKNGTIDELNRIDYYYFDNQNTYPRNVVIEPGDAVHTHCVFETHHAKADKAIPFGPSEVDEMCIMFLWYYPNMVTQKGNMYSVCEYEDRHQPDGTVFRTQCGNKGDDVDLRHIQNAPPAIPDGSGCHTIAFGNPEKVKEPVCAYPLHNAGLSEVALDTLAHVSYKPCEVNDCQNGAPCVISNNGFVRQYCACQSPIIVGEKCQYIKTQIASECDKCQNGATCVGLDYGLPTCLCKDGFTGNHCEKAEPGANSKASSTCDTSELIQCMAKSVANDDKCAHARHMATCAEKAKCSSMLEVWCDGMWKYYFGCGIQQCIKVLLPKTKPTQCNQSMFRQCFTHVYQLTVSNTLSSCETAERYHECADMSQCHDRNVIACETTQHSLQNSCSNYKKQCSALLTQTASQRTAATQLTQLHVPSHLSVIHDLVQPHGEQANESTKTSTSVVTLLTANVILVAVAVLVAMAVVYYKRKNTQDAMYSQMVEMDSA